MAQIQARPAATIVLIRNENHVLKILMLRRSSSVAAASGAHVFPGGRVDEMDAEVVDRGLFIGRDQDQAAHRLDLAGGALEYYCAALRELFEEAGLLLVLDTNGRRVEVRQEQLNGWREELLDRRVSWPGLLDREGLRLDVGDVEYLAHWVAPEGRPRRFDTRFFVAGAPEGQVVLVDDSEIVEHVWVTAATALERYESGEWSMLVPTVRTLRGLLSYENVGDVLASASDATVRRIQPREIERDGRVVVVVPGESDGDAGAAETTPR